MTTTSALARQAIQTEAKRMKLTYERMRDLVLEDLTYDSDKYTLVNGILRLKSEGTGPVAVRLQKGK